MKKLPFTTPPILPEALEIPSNRQYCSIYYCDRQPTWSTGDLFSHQLSVISYQYLSNELFDY